MTIILVLLAFVAGGYLTFRYSETIADWLDKLDDWI